MQYNFELGFMSVLGSASVGCGKRYFSFCLIYGFVCDFVPDDLYGNIHVESCKCMFSSIVIYVNIILFLLCLVLCLSTFSVFLCKINVCHGFAHNCHTFTNVLPNCVIYIIKKRFNYILNIVSVYT